MNSEPVWDQPHELTLLPVQGVASGSIFASPGPLHLAVSASGTLFALFAVLAAIAWLIRWIAASRLAAALGLRARCRLAQQRWGAVSRLTGSPLTGSPLTGSQLAGSQLAGSQLAGSPLTGSPWNGAAVKSDFAANGDAVAESLSEVGVAANETVEEPADTAAAEVVCQCPLPEAGAEQEDRKQPDAADAAAESSAVQAVGQVAAQAAGQAVGQAVAGYPVKYLSERHSHSLLRLLPWDASGTLYETDSGFSFRGSGARGQTFEVNFDSDESTINYQKGNLLWDGGLSWCVIETNGEKHYFTSDTRSADPRAYERPGRSAGDPIAESAGKSATQSPGRTSKSSATGSSLWEDFSPDGEAAGADAGQQELLEDIYDTGNAIYRRISDRFLRSN